MNRIKTERVLHESNAIVKLIFDYDAVLVSRVRQQLPASRWSRSMRCWYVEDRPQKITALQNIGINIEQKTVPNIIANDDNMDILKRLSNTRLFLSLIYACGLRRSELLNMRITDIDSKRQVVNIRHAKGDKDRIVPLSDKTLQLLRENFKQYKPQQWLFEGQIIGTRYTETSLNHIFQNVKKKAGVTIPCTLHTLRHCYATHLLEAGRHGYSLYSGVVRT